MKVSNSIFLLFACASVAPSIHASAPAPSNVPGGPSAPEGEAQIEGETGSEESTLLSIEHLKLGISGKSFRQVMCEEKNKQLAGHHAIAKSILKVVPSATPDDLSGYVGTEIRERLRKRQKEIGAYYFDEDASSSQTAAIRDVALRTEDDLRRYLSQYNKARWNKYIALYRPYNPLSSSVVCRNCHLESPSRNSCPNGCPEKAMEANEQEDWKEYQKEHCGIQ